MEVAPLQASNLLDRGQYLRLKVSHQGKDRGQTRQRQSFTQPVACQCASTPASLQMPLLSLSVTRPDDPLAVAQIRADPGLISIHLARN